MKIVRSVKNMQQITKKYMQDKQTIGFVPTMGYLHEGHLALMKQARKENDIVIASIFVNPLQFAPDEDFAQYPRDEARDQARAQEIGVDVLFMPDANEMYPEQMSIDMTVSDRVHVLCGRSRPGHFDGVVTVLSKLFNMTLPDRAYFGMKDAQQLAVVERLIAHLNFPIELVGVATVREHDGLAKSSRNVYLNEEERKKATSLYRALTYGQKLIQAGEKNPTNVINLVKENIQGDIDYVHLLSYPHLQTVEMIDCQVILACATYLGDARIIDNIIMDAQGKQISMLRFP